MTSNTAEDPAAIEREIRRTQENMSSTVEKIGDQLSIKNLFNAMLDKAEDKNIDTKMLIDGARRNLVSKRQGFKTTVIAEQKPRHGQRRFR